MAAMDSTTTAARGPIIGSWRPLMLMSIFSPDLFTVLCVLAIDGVALKYAVRRISEPSLIPPRIPPAWLLVFVGRPSAMAKPSLLAEPVAEATAHPSPISMALTAPILIIATARRASSLSKTGSPMPAGTPEMAHLTVEPMESFADMVSCKSSLAIVYAALSGMERSFVLM